MMSLYESAAKLASNPDHALPPGTRIDDYDIECVLASSSVAVVYRAYDRVLKLHVAIKEYLPSGLALREGETQVELREAAHAQGFELGRQAFISEARALARCEHGSLLPILGIVQHHGTAYRVMRYCPGPTLREHRQTLASVPGESELRVLFDSLLGALAELHQLGWVHAAVSPDNILMLPGGRPMLLDSEAVRAALISQRTRSMMAAIEPSFAPIEQREPTPDRPVGPWTDLYALAATLHFYISGHLPAVGSPERLFAPLSTLWQRLHAGQPGLGYAPPWLQALDACLAESAQDRPQSVAQLRASLDGHDSVWSLQTRAASKVVADLEQTLPFIATRAHETVATTYTPARLAEAAQPSQQRRRLWVAGTATLLLVAAVAAGEWMQSAGSTALTGDAARASSVAQPSAPPVAEVAAALPITDVPPSAGKLDVSVPAAAEPAPPLDRAIATAAPPVQVATRAPDTPRGLCGRHSGYALYQCMQSQCKKRKWTQHDQCQRMRRDRTLG